MFTELQLFVLVTGLIALFLVGFLFAKPILSIIVFFGLITVVYLEEYF